MKLFYLSYLFIWSAVLYRVDGEDTQDPVPVDNNPTLWKILYSKLNTLLNETEILMHNVKDLELRQNTQEELIRTSFNNTQKWTSIMRRQDGSINFYRSWDEYRKGFGDSNAEFFMGLEKLHILTTYSAPQELLVVLVDYEGETRYAKYDHFQIGSEAEKFNLKKLGKYDGNAGDALIEHKGMNFTTYDRDNDLAVDKNCAKLYSGAWWYYNCYMSHLTGPYRGESESNMKGVTWYAWKGQDHSLKFAEMLIRPKM